MRAVRAYVTTWLCFCCWQRHGLLLEMFVCIAGSWGVGTWMARKQSVRFFERAATSTDTRDGRRADVGTCTYMHAADGASVTRLKRMYVSSSLM
jgi:hypothetical protein